MTTVLEIPLKNIIIMGRSLGSGPATYLAGRYEVGMLVLISPFISIKAVVKDMVGSFGAMFVKDTFRNIDEIKHVKSHTLLIHGMKDEIVKPYQSDELQDACGGKCDSVFFENMTHNDINVIEWIAKPLKTLADYIGFCFNEGVGIGLPRLLFEKPPNGFNFKI